MKPMAANGGMASQFFPPNFLLQMQQPLPHHHHPQQDHHGHGHGHGHHHHPQEHHLLPSPHTVHLNPFLQDYGGMAPPPPPMLVGSKRPPPSMYPDADIDASSHHHHHHELDVHHHQPQQQEEDGAASDDEDGGSAAAGGCGGEKKRRLSVEQVRTLEKNFELGNKLEPERKVQLARGLGLQPRQVAIWFQNRRARWKTKQLEKDYDALRRQFDAARAENDALLAHNNKLQAEIVALKGSGGSCRQDAASELINLNVKETEASCSNRSENSSEINLDISRPAAAPPVETSPMHRGGTAIQFYASVGRPGAGLDIDQLLHSHSSSPAVVPLKMELGTGNDGDARDTAANFGSLLCGAVDEPVQFWPWVDGHHQFQ